MDITFLFKLLLSFIIGGAWVILATITADKYGPKVGGLISGLPSTGLFSLLFLGLTQGPQFATNAAFIVPAVVGIETLFIVIYIYLVKKSFWLALVSAFLVWFVLVFGLLVIKINNFSLSFALGILCLFLSYLTIEHILKTPTVKGKKINYTPKTILIRGLISGSVVAFSVFLGRVGGPMLGGMMSGFPATFLSTMIITYFTHGPEFSAATMKSANISVTSLIIHSITVRYTYIPLGIWLGTFVSILVSFTSGFLIYRFIILKLK